MDILRVLKEIQDDLNFISTDSVSSREARYFNRAKNNLALLISDGEAREQAKKYLTPEPASSGKLRY